jgi:NAD(P)H dehydrogenase (quinone)
MLTNTLVVFYSTYGHVHRLARAVEEGAAGVPSTEVRLRRIPELVEARKALEGTEAYQRAQEAQRHIPRRRSTTCAGRTGSPGARPRASAT